MDSKNSLFRDDDDDEDEVDEEVTLIDSSSSGEKRNKKKANGPRSSFIKQGISDQPRKKKTCRFLDTDEVVNGKEGKRVNQGELFKSGNDKEDDEDGEEDDDEDDDDAIAAVGKILIFKPRGQSKRVRRKKCLIRLIICCFVIVVTFAIASIFFKKSLELNIASLHSLINSKLHLTHASVGETRCDLNSTVTWKQSIPFIINPVIHIAQSPVYRSSSKQPVTTARVDGSTEKSIHKKVLKSSDMIVIAFETGVDAPMYPLAATCDIYFPSNHKLRQSYLTSAGGDVTQQQKQQRPFANSLGCGGGVMAIDPLDGSIIWSLLVKHAVKTFTCSVDITNDGFNDCFLTGPHSLLMAIDGVTGQIIWSLGHEDQFVHELSSNLAPLTLSYDINKGDSVNILVVNTGMDQGYTEKIPAQLLVVSSTGQVLKHLQLWLGSPAKPVVLPDTIISPLQLIDSDGTSTIIFAGESRNSLYAIPLADLMQGRLSNGLFTINDDSSSKSHIKIQPIIGNCNSDAINDIIVSFNNGTVACFNGKNFNIIWLNNSPVTGEEVKVSPTVAKITPTDFVLLITRSFIRGGGDVEYIVDMKYGHTLKRILMKPFNRHSDTHYDTGAPITLSTVEGPDLFLLWSTLTNSSINCIGERKSSYNCSFYGLVSMSLDSNSQFKFQPIYNAIDMWPDENKPGQEGFTTNELMAKWSRSTAINDINGQFDGNLPYDSLYSGVNDGDILALEEAREKRQVIKNKSPALSVEKVERGFSTAALVNKDNSLDASDVVFASWWQPVKTLDTLALPMSSLIEGCIRRYLASSEMQKLKEQMKDQQYFPQYMERLCRKQLASSQRHSLTDSEGYSSDDLLNHQLGSFTLYRYNLKCKGDKSVHISPVADQLWPQANGWMRSSVVHTSH